jgi:hypothetical protein
MSPAIALPPSPIPAARPRRLLWALSGLVLLVLTFLAGAYLSNRPPVTAAANPPASVSPTRSPSPPPPGCSVTYKVTLELASEFTGELTITNVGTKAISGWTLAFDLPDEQRVRFGLSGQWDQEGRTVTVRDLIYNRSLTPGKPISLSFLGTNSSEAHPGQFKLNGVRCTTAP